VLEDAAGDIDTLAGMTADVRPAARGDLTDVVGLLAQLAPAFTASAGGPTSTGRDEVVWAEMLAEDRRTVLVAESRGRVVGIADLVVVTSLLDGAVPHAVLDSLVVDVRSRGNGIGTSLLTAARAVALAAGCCRLEFLSSKGLTEAHRFYRGVGFQAAAEGFRMNLGAAPV
jgi:GNAT superfamily N-acetyltransferase